MTTKYIKNVFNLFLVFVLFISSMPVFALVKLPALIGNGMVLQRDKPIKIWGWAAAGEEVAVQFNGAVYQVKADAQQRWALSLPAMKAGGPYDMVIKGTNEILLKDILIGDVWICSGQSNMEFTMNRAKDTYPAEIASSTNKEIRQFFVKQKYNFQEQEDTEPAVWVSANPKSVLGFTAAGYFFALNIWQKYHIPVGLISSSVGGTPAESWMSESGLHDFPAYQKEAAFFKDQAEVDKIKNKDEAIRKAWFDRVKQEDKGYLDKGNYWYSNTFDFSKWPIMNIPGFWQSQGLKGISGVVWFKKTFTLAQDLAGKTADLYLGNIEEQDTTYVNGVRVGSTSSKHLSRKYQLPEGLLKTGENTVTIRVLDTESPGGFIAGKPYQLVIGGKTIPLNGSWQYQVGMATDELHSADFTNFGYKPTAWYNSKIAPLISYQIKGVIWYQGEANVSKAKEYQTLFPALIQDWRNKFKQGDFPFLFVQLASLGAAEPQPSDHALVRLREAQTMALSLKNTGMAVAHDIGEWNDIHPQNKKEVGKRLFAAAEKVAYHEPQAVASGPLFKSVKLEGGKMTILFTNTGTGLVAKDNQELKYFAVSGADKKFVWAKAEIRGNMVVVWSEQVASPVYVRYAWARNPEGANLYSREGLPAVSFRTDKEE